MVAVKWVQIAGFVADSDNLSPLNSEIRRRDGGAAGLDVIALAEAVQRWSTARASRSPMNWMIVTMRTRTMMQAIIVSA